MKDAMVWFGMLALFLGITQVGNKGRGGAALLWLGAVLVTAAVI